MHAHVHAGTCIMHVVFIVTCNIMTYCYSNDDKHSVPCLYIYSIIFLSCFWNCYHSESIGRYTKKWRKRMSVLHSGTYIHVEYYNRAATCAMMAWIISLNQLIVSLFRSSSVVSPATSCCCPTCRNSSGDSPSPATPTFAACRRWFSPRVLETLSSSTAHQVRLPTLYTCIIMVLYSYTE